MVNVALDARGNLMRLRAVAAAGRDAGCVRAARPTGSRSLPRRASTRRDSRRRRRDGCRASRSTRARTGTAPTPRTRTCRSTSRRPPGAAGRSPSRSSVPGAVPERMQVAGAGGRARGAQCGDSLLSSSSVMDRRIFAGAPEPSAGPRRPARRVSRRRPSSSRDLPALVALLGAPRPRTSDGGPQLLLTAISTAVSSRASSSGSSYIAIEPIVRRRWPDLLFSWSRLLAGRFRDPLVGRDVLAGILVGASMMLLVEAASATPNWIDLPGMTPVPRRATMLSAAGPPSATSSCRSTAP